MSENKKSLKKFFRNAGRHLKNAVAPDAVIPLNNEGLDNSVINLVAFSSNGREMLRYASNEGIYIKAGFFGVSTGGSYEADAERFDSKTKKTEKVKTVCINNFRSNKAQAATFYHELIHAYQDRDGLLAKLTSENLDFKSAYLLLLSCEAGAHAQTGVDTYKLALMGNDKMWQSYKKENPQLSKVIENSLDDKKEFDADKAYTAAFKEFFNPKNARKAIYTGLLKENMLQCLEQEDAIDVYGEESAKIPERRLKPKTTIPTEDIVKYCTVYNGKSCLKNASELEGFDYMAVPMELFALAKQVNDMEVKHGRDKDNTLDGFPIEGAYESYASNLFMKSYRQQVR